MNNNILDFTNYSIEKLVFSACLSDYKILYLKESNEFVYYKNINFKFIINSVLNNF